MPLQTPELALTLIETLPDVGRLNPILVEFALHVRASLTVVRPLQVAVGAGEIAFPTVPVVAVILQVKTGVETVILPH
jgi:hypothetical protein